MASTRPTGRPQCTALPAAQSKSLTHRIALALVWMTIVSSAVVFSEPAPVDILMMGLIVGLPVVGLVAMTPPLLAMLAVWLLIASFSFAAASFSAEIGRATIHTAISLYLYLAAFTIAGFVALSPGPHGRLVFNAYLVSATLAAAVAILAYAGLVPDSEMFLKFGRAAGTFKDPNVFGPFLVPAIVYCLHLWLTRPPSHGLPPLAALALLAIGLLLSFSRGAWIAAAMAILIYAWLYFVTARRSIDRIKIAALALLAGATLPMLLCVALQIGGVGELLSERFALQGYDQGPDGRFGGHEKAQALILDHPFGIGALDFQTTFHHEDAHNVYLTMFLSAGWLGGLLYLMMVAGTLLIGLRQAFRSTPTQPLLLVALASLAAMAFEGVVIDTDHWRHFYILVGLVWGLAAGEWRTAAASQPATLTREFLGSPRREEAAMLRPTSQPY